MPYMRTKTGLTKALKELHDKLSLYISDDLMIELMCELDRDINRFHIELKIKVQSTIYRQVAKLIDEGKLIDPNKVKE